MRFDHPVFQGPRKVDTTTVDKIDEYSKKKIKAWKVQEDQKAPGLVATRRRFVNSPDSEILAGGTNMKGDRGVPLVREGNLFLWGFSAPPSEMTEPGRAAFINAVTYIKKFDGQTPIRRVGISERTRWKGIISSPYVKPDRLPTYFGQDLVAKHGTDKDAYKTDLEQRERFLYVKRGTATLSIDADAEKLGQPTGSLELLKAALIRGGELGERVMKRYWPEDDLVLPRPKNIKELEAVASKVMFSESHGYRWLSKPPVAAPQTWEIIDAIKAMELPKPSEFAPAIFGARLVGGYNAKSLAYDKKLGLVTLAIRADVLDQWHLTLEAEDAETVTVKFEVELGKGMEWHSKTFKLQGNTRKRDGVTEGFGELTWTREIWIKTPANSQMVKGKITFQACDEERCLPPVEYPFEARITVR